ncbi:hypothetical protein ONZ45_g2452 [Pleurotus djamor]|nr:hypothetical protein ONZ45_g2452 [Pleurotus djamor]
METSHIDLNLDAKLGAMFLGNVVAAILYGVTSVQTFIYFKGSAQDLRSLKVIVLILWLLDSLHIILVTHTVYFYTVSNYADPLSLNTPIWSNVSQVYTTCISDLIVRGPVSPLEPQSLDLVCLRHPVTVLWFYDAAILAFVSRGFEFKSMTALVHVSVRRSRCILLRLAHLHPE